MKKKITRGEKEPKYSKCEYFELKKPIDKRELDKYYCGHEENMESECEYASCPLGYSINTFKDSRGEKVEFRCLECGNLFSSWNDGKGWISTLCPKCSLIHNTVGLDEKRPEPKDFYLGEKGFVVLNEKEAEPENKDKLEGSLD